MRKEFWRTLMALGLAVLAGSQALAQTLTVFPQHQFNFRIAGMEARMLRTDVTGVGVRCWVFPNSGTAPNLGSGAVTIPARDENGERVARSGPFTIGMDATTPGTQPGDAHSYECTMFLVLQNGTFSPVQTDCRGYPSACAKPGTTAVTQIRGTY